MLKTVRILSIDGGGVRGILPIIFLTALEKELRRPLHTCFDLVAGTSIGAMIACGIVAPKPLTAQRMLDTFVSKKNRIFPTDRFRQLSSVIARSKYDPEPLEELLAELFGMSRLSQCVTELLIPTYEIEKREAVFFKSWKARGEGGFPPEPPATHDFYIKDVIRASAAAPTYFPPAYIRSISGAGGAYIDGAITANNPAMCALASARKLHPEAERFIILSLGTGQQCLPIKYADAVKFGLLSWPRPIIECLIDAAADIVDYQIDEAFGANVIKHRVQFNIGRASGEIDDASDANMARLIVAGEEEVARRGALIASLPSILSLQDRPDNHQPKHGFRE